MTDAYQVVRSFLPIEEMEDLLKTIESRQDLFHETSGRRGFGPRYQVIGGESVRECLPKLVHLGGGRIKPLVEHMAGQPLQVMADMKRSVRIQRYRTHDDGFRWHFDGNSYAAILTLKNENRAETHLFGPSASKVLQFILYPLYPFPSILSMFPYQKIGLNAGDLLILRGGSILHRGVVRAQSGERLIAVFGFDEQGKRPNPLRDRIARAMNY